MNSTFEIIIETALFFVSFGVVRFLFRKRNLKARKQFFDTSQIILMALIWLVLVIVFRLF